MNEMLTPIDMFIYFWSDLSLICHIERKWQFPLSLSLNAFDISMYYFTQTNHIWDPLFPTIFRSVQDEGKVVFN